MELMLAFLTEESKQAAASTAVSVSSSCHMVASWHHVIVYRRTCPSLWPTKWLELIPDHTVFPYSSCSGGSTLPSTVSSGTTTLADVSFHVVS